MAAPLERCCVVSKRSVGRMTSMGVVPDSNREFGLRHLGFVSIGVVRSSLRLGRRRALSSTQLIICSQLFCTTYNMLVNRIACLVDWIGMSSTLRHRDTHRSRKVLQEIHRRQSSRRANGLSPSRKVKRTTFAEFLHRDTIRLGYNIPLLEGGRRSKFSVDVKRSGKNLLNQDN